MSTRRALAVGLVALAILISPDVPSKSPGSPDVSPPFWAWFSRGVRHVMLGIVLSVVGAQGLQSFVRGAIRSGFTRAVEENTPQWITWFGLALVIFALYSLIRSHGGHAQWGNVGVSLLTGVVVGVFVTSWQLFSTHESLKATVEGGVNVAASVVPEGEKPSLAGVDWAGFPIEGQRLAGFDLTGANFSEADLSGTSFVLAEVGGLDMTNADLTGVSFQDAEGFETAETRGATFRDTTCPDGTRVSGDQGCTGHEEPVARSSSE